MPRAGESQLSLSVQQEGSGAMRMSLRAAYSLTHEPESSFAVVYVTTKRPDGNIYVIINRSRSSFYPQTSIHSITSKLTIISRKALSSIEKTMYTFLPPVDPSTLSRADSTGLSRPSTLYHAFTGHLALSS
mgnify:FL=1